MQNLNSYINALNKFYTSLAYWRYSKDTKSDDLDNKKEELKNNAKSLKNEMENLPPDMIRPQVVDHIEKALSL